MVESLPSYIAKPVSLGCIKFHSLETLKYEKSVPPNVLDV